MTNLLKIIIAISSLFLLLLSCNSKSNNSNQLKEATNGLLELSETSLKNGFQTLQSSCFSCHSPNSAIQNKIAPTLADIKINYLKDHNDLSSFSDAFNKFLLNPNEQNAIIPDAIKNYGIMPRFDLSETQSNNAAYYLFHTDIQNKKWYDVQFQKDKKIYVTDPSSLSYLELGKKYALSTKAILGKNLKSAIKSKGTEEAVGFCNLRAYPLTDSMALQLNTEIKRVSDKNRNPKNRANKLELQYIKEAKLQLASGNKIKPRLQEIDNKMIAYYPIVTNKMCLQCHGVPDVNIKEPTMNKIKSLYPNDLATAYSDNELRGIWVVKMDKKK